MDFYQLINRDDSRKYNADIVDVYDGDTVTATIHLGLNIILHSQKIRLCGIDTPEIRGDERVEGIKARDYVRTKILHRSVILHTIKNDKCDKYGRLLGIIQLNDEIINQLLLEHGLAKLYAK